jgi:hypothetical protein
MKITKFFSLFIVLLFVSKANSQEFKLGKVSIAELEQKVHPKDTAAVAAILYKKGNSQIEYNENEGFILTTNVETRIKIYKKEGYNWANQSVQYYNVASSNSKEIVSFSDAVTYNLVNGKIEKTKLKSDGFFEEQINKFYGRKKITMPNVKEGSVLEFKYTVKTHNVGMIPQWNFQYEIPVNYSQFATFLPDYYSYNVRQKGFIQPNVVSEKNHKSIILTDRKIVISNGTKFSEDKIDYVEIRNIYTEKDLPAMKEESFVNNIDNYTSTIEHELSMVQYPNKGTESFSTDWNSVVKTIYNYDDFGPELNKTGYFEDDLNVILKGVTAPEEKILLILNFVKSNVKWNGYEGYSCNDGVRKAYKDKTGNIAEINLMLTAMLRYAGLTANPVLVSTRSNGIAMFPNRTAFNYVIAAVETANGNILLDASNKFSAPNVLPFRTLNWFGRLIRKDGTSEAVDLMPKTISNDNVFMNYSIDPDGKISGRTRRQFSDYNAMIFRDEVSEVKQEAYLEKLENENNQIEVSEYTRANEKEILLPTVESYSFTGNNLCELINGKIYVNPMLFFTNDKNPFKQEIREYPVDFGFPFSDKYNITIQIPDGFAVETLPAPALITMENNLGIFRFNAVPNGNSLQLIISHQINEAIVTTEQYEMLKEYYKGMIAKETEKIVLKRI